MQREPRRVLRQFFPNNVAGPKRPPVASPLNVARPEIEDKSLKSRKRKPGRSKIASRVGVMSASRAGVKTPQEFISGLASKFKPNVSTQDKTKFKKAEQDDLDEFAVSLE